MLESKHVGYSSSERYSDDSTEHFKADPMERIIRFVLVICFIGVLSLEFWLLISALGSS